MKDHTPLDITVISAGAGSGKTYTLTGRMVEMLRSGVRAKGIIATTFTQKAAAELQERVRTKLLEEGMTTEANDLGAAMIGTVHSIGIRLLQRFAFEIGVSPLVEAIAAGDEQRLFNASLSQVLSPDRIDQMNLLADRLGLTKKTFGEPFDWRKVIRQVTDVARANQFSADVLDQSRQKSWETLAAFLPPVQPVDDLTWNNRLLAHIEQTIAALADDQAVTTQKAVAELQQTVTQLKWRGELYWFEWAKIGKLNTTKKSLPLIEELQAFANSHDAHPRFQADLRGFIDLVFYISMDALREFEVYKQKRGLIDYTDMETYVRRLLQIPAVRATLADELDLLLVDEFQDTSPIQLDIFLQLSRIAKHSIWVGDPKQSIYGFRGAEPALMKAIVDATGGIKDENILKQSWRSRADIVEATNSIFTRCFTDLPAEQIVLQPTFSAAKEAECIQKMGASTLPSALMHWSFNLERAADGEQDAAKKPSNRPPAKPWTEDCIARQTLAFVAGKTPVFNKKRNSLRPVQPGDMAILCRNNTDCQAIAEALYRVGLPASIARSGLLSTPEVRLVLAHLKVLVNPNDRLSYAEIGVLSGELTLESLLQNPDDLRQRMSHTITRTDTSGLSAAETLDLLLAELDLRRIIVQLGNPVQRLDNIECLRRYALEYESACDRMHSAATIGGFLLWLDQLADQGLDMQGRSESEDAVNVLTYHRSKGLEYPVVVLHNLDSTLKEQIWGISLVADAPPNLDHILGGRWLRYWVNPYSDQINGTRLLEQIQQSEVFTKANRAALDEEARLLYVGITRARDYLIFPTTVKPTAWLNRTFNKGDGAIPVLDPHSDETPFYTQEQQVILAETAVVMYPKEMPSIENASAEVDYYSVAKGRGKYAPFQIDSNSELPPCGVSYQIGELVAFSTSVALGGPYRAAADQLLRAVLVADQPNIWPKAERQAMIEHQIQVRGVQDLFDATAVQLHSEAFFRWIQNMFPLGVVLRLVPLRYDVDGRRFEATLDFLVKIPNGDVALLHYVATQEGLKKWKHIAQSLVPHLGWCRQALQTDDPSIRLDAWLIFGLEGQCVRIE